MNLDDDTLKEIHLSALAEAKRCKVDDSLTKMVLTDLALAAKAVVDWRVILSETPDVTGLPLVDVLYLEQGHSDESSISPLSLGYLVKA